MLKPLANVKLLHSISVHWSASISYNLIFLLGKLKKQNKTKTKTPFEYY